MDNENNKSEGNKTEDSIVNKDALQSDKDDSNTDENDANKMYQFITSLNIDVNMLTDDVLKKSWVN